MLHILLQEIVNGTPKFRKSQEDLFRPASCQLQALDYTVSVINTQGTQKALSTTIGIALPL